jgi:hypothetical protein
MAATNAAIIFNLFEPIKSAAPPFCARKDRSRHDSALRAIRQRVFYRNKDMFLKKTS